MDIKVRNIGNAVGLILPKSVSSDMGFHAGDVVTIMVRDHVLNVHKKTDDIKDRILQGIRASEKENLEFSESFSDMKSEQW